MQLYLIRHGQSVNNAMMEDQLKRVHDPELTEVGKQQAQHLADYFVKSREYITSAGEKELPLASAYQENMPIDLNKLYCSAMHRALQTAQPLATALKMKTNVWLDIHEQGGVYLEKEGVVTGYGGRTRKQITDEFPDYLLPDLITEDGWWLPNDGYEDYARSIGRAIRVADTLKKWATEPETAEDRVGLVSHGTFIDTLLKALTSNLPGSAFYYNHWNTAITRIDFTTDQREMRIRYINRVDHLPTELVTW
jgi:2,3-bisphosphoglycerate-dependent phosphoglycerate mutase